MEKEIEMELGVERKVEQEVKVKEEYSFEKLRSVWIGKQNQKKLIVVYCPPKVGSTTLVTSLRLSVGNEYSVVHVHDVSLFYYLDPSLKEQEEEEEEEEEEEKGQKKRKRNKLDMMMVFRYLSKCYDKVIIIDVYRPRFEFCVSNFFEQLMSFHFNITKEEDVEKLSMEKISKRFTQVFWHIEYPDYYDGFCSSLGGGLTKEEEKEDSANILPAESSKIPVDGDKSLRMFDWENLRFVKLRLQDASEGLWKRNLAEILQVDPSVMVIYTQNETSKKSSFLSKLYQQFQERYQIPFSFFCQLQQDDSFSRYMTKEEKEKYFHRLVLKVASSSAPSESSSSSSFVLSWSSQEYKLYFDISLENQLNATLQKDHYFDEGCICNFCKDKRRKIKLKIQQFQQLNSSPSSIASSAWKMNITINEEEDAIHHSLVMRQENKRKTKEKEKIIQQIQFRQQQILQKEKIMKIKDHFPKPFSSKSSSSASASSGFSVARMKIQKIS